MSSREQIPGTGTSKLGGGDLVNQPELVAEDVQELVGRQDEANVFDEDAAADELLHHLSSVLGHRFRVVFDEDARSVARKHLRSAHRRGLAERVADAEVPAPRQHLCLTSRQREALDFIMQHQNEYGYSPTLREIGEHMGIRSTNGVNEHLKALERKGYIERRENLSRSIKVI